jgi:hypothetical protein
VTLAASNDNIAAHLVSPPPGDDGAHDEQSNEQGGGRLASQRHAVSMSAEESLAILVT